MAFEMALRFLNGGCKRRGTVFETTKKGQRIAVISKEIKLHKLGTNNRMSSERLFCDVQQLWSAKPSKSVLTRQIEKLSFIRWRNDLIGSIIRWLVRLLFTRKKTCDDSLEENPQKQELTMLE